MAGANIPRYEFVESARVKNNKCKNKTPGLLLINSRVRKSGNLFKV